MPLLRALRFFADLKQLDLVSARTELGYVQSFCFSPDWSRRYLYAQVWDPAGSTILWVMFNPGTGETEGRRRPTLARCLRWSQARGHGSLLFCNLSSLRTKSARDLPESEQFAEPLNLEAITFARERSSELLVAWGAALGRRQLTAGLSSMLEGALCLGQTRKGHPRHPLYVPSDAQPSVWRSGA